MSSRDMGPEELFERTYGVIGYLNFLETAPEFPNAQQVWIDRIRFEDLRPGPNFGTWKDAEEPMWRNPSNDSEYALVDVRLEV